MALHDVKSKSGLKIGVEENEILTNTKRLNCNISMTSLEMIHSKTDTSPLGNNRNLLIIFTFPKLLHYHDLIRKLKNFLRLVTYLLLVTCFVLTSSDMDARQQAC